MKNNYIINFKQETSSLKEARIEIEQLSRNPNIDNIAKIEYLKKIEEDKYKPLIEKLVYKEGVNEIKALTIILKEVGYLTTLLGQLSGDIKYYTESAVLYQYVITIVKEKLNAQAEKEFIEERLTNAYQQLMTIQQLIFLAIGGSKESIPNVKEEAENNQQLLLTLRNKAGKEIVIIESYNKQINTCKEEEKLKYENLYVNTTQILFKEIAQEIKKFLAKIYNDSEKEMSILPPCKYAVMGLGSMALQQMTPYSDLEFAILTENEEYKNNDDPKIKNYFKNLSHLVNFKIINLSETIIPTSKYGIDMSHLVHRGVNLDLGGKTPLGRIDNGKPYEIIKTVEWMLHYIRNEQNHASNIDKNLPYILEKVCYVHGQKELVQNYQTEVTKFLHSRKEDDPENRLNCEIRAIKLLKEEIIEINYFAREPLTPSITYKGDIDKNRPCFTNNAGESFSVKQEIYRLPDRMIYNISMYFSIEAESALDAINQLEKEGIIGSKAAANLKNAVTFAIILRLKTYLHYKSQTEDMAPIANLISNETIKEFNNNQSQKIFHLANEDLQETGALFKYFYTALPLHQKIEKFCNEYNALNEAEQKAFFNKERFYEENSLTKGLIYCRLMQLKEAQSNLELAVENSSNEYDNINLRLALGMIYCRFSKLDKAIIELELYLKMVKSIYNDKLLLIKTSQILCLLGLSYCAHNKHEEALNCYNKSLKIYKQIYKEEVTSDFISLRNNMGLLLVQNFKYDEAVENFNANLLMAKQLHKNLIHGDIATSLTNLGFAYFLQGNYDQAIKHSKKALNMLILINKGGLHPKIISLWLNIGTIYAKQEKYIDAENYFMKALEVKKVIYKEKESLEIACILNNLGILYFVQEKYDNAINYSSESLNILNLFPNKPPLMIPSIWMRLASCHLGKKEFEEGIYNLIQGFRSFQDIDSLNPTEITLIENVAILANKLQDKNDQFNDKYSLNPFLMLQIMNFYIQEKMDFMNSQVHYNIARTNYYYNNNLYEAIEAYKLALIFIKEEQKELECSINQNLGRMYHVAAIQAKETKKDLLAQQYYDKANNAFIRALEINKLKSTLLTEYANFLLEQGLFLETAYEYLNKAINSKDTVSILEYRLLDKGTLTEILKDKIDTKTDKAMISVMPYAYYLLLHNYNKFAETKIETLKTKEEYLKLLGEAVSTPPNRDIEGIEECFIKESLGQHLVYWISLYLIGMANLEAGEEKTGIEYFTLMKKFGLSIGILTEEKLNCTEDSYKNFKALLLGNQRVTKKEPDEANISIDEIINPGHPQAEDMELSDFVVINENDNDTTEITGDSTSSSSLACNIL